MLVDYGTLLRMHRRRQAISQTELAVAMGRTNACWISRREAGVIAMDRAEYTAAIAAIEALAKARTEAANLEEALA